MCAHTCEKSIAIEFQFSPFRAATNDQTNVKDCQKSISCAPPCNDAKTRSYTNLADDGWCLMYTCLLCRLAFRAPFTSSSEKSPEPWQPKWSQGIWGSIDSRFLNICWTIIKWQTSEIYNALRSWRFISLTVPVSFFCLIAEHKSNLPRFTFENRPSKAHQKDYKELHLVPKLSWNILKPGWWHWLNYFLFTRPKIGSKTSAIWGWFPRYISR